MDFSKIIAKKFGHVRNYALLCIAFRWKAGSLEFLASRDGLEPLQPSNITLRWENDVN